MNTTKISINELSALLKRVLESLYADNKDYEDTAQLALWLEIHNLNGITTLLSAMEHITNHDAVIPTLVTDDVDRCVIDNMNGSLFNIACVATDMTIAKSSFAGYCHTNIINCQHLNVIIPCVARCGARGYSSSAWWFETSAKQLHVASISANQTNPKYRIMEIGSESDIYHRHVDLICSQEKIDLSDSYEHLGHLMDSARQKKQISSIKFKQRFEKNQNNGLTIDEANYLRLYKIADQILVEATEKSRHNAGE